MAIIQNRVGEFTIPEELAKELSDLLTKQSIRRDTLVQLVGDEAKYTEMEAMLVPITERIEEIKVKITNEFVPEKFMNPKYTWSYDGYAISGNNVNVFETI